jgi:hypothetical protein
LSYAQGKLERSNEDLSIAIKIGDQVEALNVKPRKYPVTYMLHEKVRVDWNRWIMMRHREIVGRLQWLALDGRLNPLNRSRFVAIFDWIMIMLVFNVLFNHQLIDFVSSKGANISANDILGFVVQLILIIFTCVGALLLEVNLVLTFYDQLELIERTRKMILHIITINEIRFDKLVSITTKEHNHLPDNRRGSLALLKIFAPTNQALPGQIKQQEVIDEMGKAIELDLLTVIIQTRLTSRIFDLSKRPMGLIVSVFIGFVILMSIILRVHNPYFYPESKGTGKLIVLVAISVLYGFLMPLAFLHRRSLNSFQKIWNLVALLNRFESIPQIKRELMMSSSVSVLTLRRELSDSRRLMSRFACRVFSLQVTYANLMQIAGWISIIMFSFVDRSDSLIGEILAVFLRDPFKLFKVE